MEQKQRNKMQPCVKQGGFVCCHAVVATLPVEREETENTDHHEPFFQAVENGATNSKLNVLQGRRNPLKSNNHKIPINRSLGGLHHRTRPTKRITNFKVGMVFSKRNGCIRLLSKPEQLHDNHVVRSPRGKPTLPLLKFSNAKVVDKKRLNLGKFTLSSLRIQRKHVKYVSFVNQILENPDRTATENEPFNLQFKGLCFITLGAIIENYKDIMIVAVGIPKHGKTQAPYPLLCKRL